MPLKQKDGEKTMGQVLRDRNGRRLGEIKEVGGGKLEIRDSNGRRCGTYDPREDRTRDSQGRPIGSGNLLATLLPSNG